MRWRSHIRMRVKGRFEGGIGIRGYDGEAAELVHVNAAGVTFVFVVYDGQIIWP